MASNLTCVLGRMMTLRRKRTEGTPSKPVTRSDYGCKSRRHGQYQGARGVSRRAQATTPAGTASSLPSTEVRDG